MSTPHPLKAFGLGALPSPPDDRDIPLELDWLRVGVGQLPLSVDLRNLCPPIFNQGSVNSCTANALATAVYIERTKHGMKPPFIPARLFNYWYSRAREGKLGRNEGVYIRDAFKAANNEGMPSEANFPYSETNYLLQPDATIVRQGKHHRVATYRAVPNDLLGVQQSIANRFPVVFGLPIYESFYSTGPDGVIPLPQAGEMLYGYHCMIWVAYEGDVLIPANSWGSNTAVPGGGFGDHGYGRMHPDWLQHTFDTFTVHSVRA